MAPSSLHSRSGKGRTCYLSFSLLAPKPDTNVSEQVRPVDGGRRELRCGVEGVHAMSTVSRDGGLDGQGDGRGDGEGVGGLVVDRVRVAEPRGGDDAKPLQVGGGADADAAAMEVSGWPRVWQVAILKVSRQAVCQSGPRSLGLWYLSCCVKSSRLL